MPGYMFGSKRARNTPSITNKANCGGPKKGGLAPTVGVDAIVGTGLRIRGTTRGEYKLVCPASYKNYRGVLPTTGIVSRLQPGQAANGKH